jgi:Leucine-rich repeat (LRR) protein
VQLPELPTLEDLDLSGCEIESIEADRYPNIQVLELRDNQISRVQDIEELAKLPKLAELNIEGNPICYIGNLKEEIFRVCPFLEVLDGEELLEAGYRFVKDSQIL